MFDVFSQKNRILLRELIKTDFKLRYQGSAIGYLTLRWRCSSFPSCFVISQCYLGIFFRSNFYGDGISC